jgi:hypothetical protein
LKRWPPRTAVCLLASWFEPRQLSTQGWCTQERWQHATHEAPETTFLHFWFCKLVLKLQKQNWMSRKQQHSMLVRRVLSAPEATSAEALVALSNWDLLYHPRIDLRHSASSCHFRYDPFVWLVCSFQTYDAPFRIERDFDCIWSESIQFRKQLFW